MTTEELIESLYRELGTIDEVAEALPDVPIGTIRRVIDLMPDRENYRRRGALPTYSKSTLRAHLKLAAKELGEPLSGLKYQKLAAERGLAAYNTQVKAFGSFPRALEAAGVRGNKPRGRRASSFTPEQCVEAVRECVRDNGGQRVSYAAYREWVTEGKPSGSTVRLLVGWNEAVKRALATV